jgi:hypothetical protein
MCPHYTTEKPLSERNSDKIYMLGPRIAALQKIKETAASDVAAF